MKRTILLTLVAMLGVVGEIGKADFTFIEALNLEYRVNSPYSDLSACISADGLSLFFSSNRAPGGFQDFDLWVSTRPAEDEDWEEPVHLDDTLNSRGMEWTPCISSDGLELYFAKGVWNDTDIVVSRRNSVTEPWGAAENLGPAVNSPDWDSSPSITADGLELYFGSTRSGGLGSSDLYVTKRTSTSDPWGPAVNLGPTINSADGSSIYGDGGPSISPDGLVLFFNAARPPGSAGNLDIWMTRRATRQDEWAAPVRLGRPVNSAWHDTTPSISPDGRMLYFVSGRPGGVGGDTDFWQAPVIPVADFNSDGIVDSTDMCFMVDHWGTNEPLCDIGPTPLGDGIVDVQDLIVLAEYLFEDIPLPPELIAYWRLDEGEGDIAYDSVGDKAGLLIGGPVGHPGEGKRDGALELDGIDDYVSTPFVLNPISSGPFSVFAWTKGGAPGQVIISQAERTVIRLTIPGSTWLGTDPSEGKLMTELRGSDESSEPLLSEAIITDDQWHHIGLVWDGLYRSLYVDGSEVAKDTDALDSLLSSDSGLYIGASETLDATSFFRGLIDDVRIYDVALRADKIEALAR